jgi:TusE/DsrC/DsvC family sulfur relay protein
VKAMETENRLEDLSFDDEGFLEENEQWNEEIAFQIARREGLDSLDSEQLDIIKTLRSHYQKHHNFPILASICKKVGSRWRDCVARDFHNPMIAWKIAGLPKPPNIFFSSFDGEHYVANPNY